MHPIVIVGSGLAGYTLLKELRKRDTETPVTLVTADDGAFYSKPNLSNALATGRTAAALASASAEKMAADLNATVLTHTRVTAIDTQGQRIRTEPASLSTASWCSRSARPVSAWPRRQRRDRCAGVNDLTDYVAFRNAIDGKKRITVLAAA